jgi:hypothetical protein
MRYRRLANGASAATLRYGCCDNVLSQKHETKFVAPELDARYLAHTLATLHFVRDEIDAMERCGAVACC